MKCLKSSIMMLYLDKTLPGKKMKQAAIHLSRCPKCQENLEKMENNLHLVMRKMDLLAPGPEQVPTVDADAGVIFPGKSRKTREKFSFPNPFAFGKANFILKPAVLVLTVTFLIISLLVLVIQFPHPGEPQRSPWDYGPDREKQASQFSIQSVKLEEQPAQTYIIKERDTKTTIIWVEKE